ncbi:hypothetical protein RIF29_40935 [Crotalaria pallida]|uniref:4a-hydroxytetrahydrobiopterin dehydratase n=1 Tax=Crotalaria pallida TaxID=3830 RepID=A0AAN9HS53_CROPI
MNRGRIVDEMNRVLLFRHPLHALRLSNPLLPIPFFQSHPYTPTPTRMDSEKMLNNKKCVPCNSKDLRPMTHDSAHALIQQVAQWNLINEGDMLKLRRSWKVKTFTKGLEFFRRIADLAEAEGHHPDLHLVGWNNVTIEIWTHAVGGLTENDFILAAKINELNLHDLLRRSV